MLSTESWPEPALRFLTLAQRFQKFLVVGAVGLAVNFAMLFVLHEFVQLSLRMSGVIAIAISMVVTFCLNELWTWHDRGRGRVVTRMIPYAVINSIGLLINTEILVFLSEQGMYYLAANLVGAGIAAIWNFGVNNAVTWRS